MKKICFALLFLFLSVQIVEAQTQAEIDAITKKLQDEIDRMKKDPKYKDIMKDVPDIKKTTVTKEKEPADIKKPATLKPDNRKLPARNITLLSQLPKKTLTPNELATFLNTLNTQLRQKIKSPAADLLIQQYGKSGEKLSYLAVVAWYKNDPEAALLLAAKAATLLTDDDASLSNCAAIFTMAGLGNKAIPVLQVLLQQQPNSSTVLNNIGQAYTALGDEETAMLYFGRCIKIAPEHPEANNTAAIIAMKKGQTEQAKKYCAQALKGSLTTEAVKTYGHLYPEDNIEDYVDIEPWKMYPFNEHDFTFPPQCEKVADAAKSKLEIEAYEKRYMAMAEKNKTGYSAEMQSKSQQLSAEFAKNPLANMEMANSQTPFSRRAGYAYHRIVVPLTASLIDVLFKQDKEIMSLNAEYDAKKNQLSKNYLQEREACGGNNACESKAYAKHCRSQNELSDQYLPRYAVINRDYVSKVWRLNKEIFQAFSAYVRMGVRRNTIQFYGQESGRIEMLYSNLINGVILRNGYKIIMPYCDMTDAEMKRIDSMDLKEDKNCNLNLEIPAGPVTMVISCDQFDISGGELLKLKYNKDFRSGQTTLYAGVGVSTGIPGFEAGAAQYIFISFDRNNQPVDVGIQGEAGIDVKGIVGADQIISYRATINNGVSFEPGPMQAIANALPYAFK